jgi:hypothetical protein
MEYPRFRGKEKAMTYPERLKKSIEEGKTKIETMSSWGSEITRMQLTHAK